MTSQQEAVKAIYEELIAVAVDEGQRERERLGREMTEGEAASLADMIGRQFTAALAMTRAMTRA